MIDLIKFRPQENIGFKGVKKRTSQIKRVFTSTKTNFESPKEIQARNDIELQRIKNEKAYNQFLGKSGMVTLEEYEKIKKNHPEIILRAGKFMHDFANRENLCIEPKDCAFIIKYLNKMINNDTKIISVGTSPSFITEGLKAIGKDVVFLPMSGGNLCLGRSTINDYFEYYPNFKIVGEYLKYLGITPEKVKGKHIMILDFSVTGRTMLLISRLVREFCKIDQNQTSCVEIEDLIESAFESIPESEKNNKSDYLDTIHNELLYQKTENASNVPHFSIYSDRGNQMTRDSVSSARKSKSEVFREFEEFSRPSARIFQLCVLNELDISGELKKVQENNNENR